MPQFHDKLDVFNFDKLLKCNVNLGLAVALINATAAASAVEIEKLSESGRYAIMTPVLNAMVESLGVVKHYAQYLLREGVIARGQPDWALIRRGMPIFIVEGKVAINRAAIAQTVLQMYEAYMEMRPKDHTEPWEMYGMLTTAVKVVFVKALFCGEQCDGVWRSKEFQIPHRKDMETKTYEDSVRPVIQHAVAIANKQIEQIKRVPNEQTQQ
jgi:hypothetical protein